MGTFSGDFMLVLQALFGPIWSLFTDWCFPGTKITPAAWAFFSLTFVLVLSILKRYFMGGDSDG